jgi:uncharacterized protein with HEPN domain
MKSSDIQRIQRIKTYCADIEQTVSRFGSDYAIFKVDRDFYNSVSMSMMQIGELSAGLSEDFKRETSGIIPWGLVKSMRNMFAHAYHSMEKDTIWETAMRDVPMLLQFCESIIKENPQEH